MDNYMVYNIDINIVRGLFMGLVIRVLYNNQNWQSPCKRPGMDGLCQACLRENKNLDIKRPSKSDEVCQGLCWERDLCTNYEWGCTPRGREFGSRAYKGKRVFFVFQQPDHKYTLWGRTTVDSVNVPPKRTLTGHEVGYNSWMRFTAFNPLLRDRWVKDLSDIDLVEEMWKQGRYRFISASKEAELENLMKVTESGKSTESSTNALPISGTIVRLELAPTIITRLKKAANEDGRLPEDIIREAIAGWLRERGV
jgi:hypothetical protein